MPDLSSLGGRWFETVAGPGYVIESRYDAGHTHGAIPLHRALTLDPARLAGQMRDGRIAGCAGDRFLYIDTETTGLGGAGAMVFLAGTARFEGSTLILRQFLLPNPTFEYALLGGLAHELDRAEALVSFNGKSFDVPQLESRFILARQQPAWRDLPHVDLLHPNRRLFRRDFDSYRLPRLEVELLGFEREDDCPSAEVPYRYFQFQRTNDPTWIQPVLRHNAWDILSLVALAAHLAAVCEGAAGPLRAARAAEYAGDLTAAARLFEESAATDAGRADRLEALERAATAYARLRDFESASRMWRALLEDPRHRRLTPHVELAKIHEHRFKDPPGALDLVDTALKLVSSGQARPGRFGTETSAEALAKRRERLLSKTGSPGRHRP